MKTTIKKLAGVLCLLCTVCIFIACEELFPSRVGYTFNNQSSYAIYVTFDKAYQYKNYNGDYVDSNTKVLTVYDKSSNEIFLESTSVDFSWTTYNENDNQKIFCVVNQNKATFKDRQGGTK